LRRSEAKVAELQAEYAAQFVTDRAKAQVVREKLDAEQANLALARERAADLVAHAKTDGIFMAPEMVDMPGRYYRRGELLGYVVGETNALARVVVPQEAVDKVRLATGRVRVYVRLTGRNWRWKEEFCGKSPAAASICRARH
jgi:putative peptide zinc metalloprotease protein